MEDEGWMRDACVAPLVEESNFLNLGRLKCRRLAFFFSFFFKVYRKKKRKEKKKLTYGTKKVKGVSFLKHRGKDEDNEKRIRMQPE
jgi:hypothetical protein